MSAKTPRSILFVCLGNICRSPLAEGVFRHVASEAGGEARLVIDSAGTGAWHVGNPPDPRSIAIAAKYGIDIATQRARKVVPADFEAFDLLLGLDRANVETLLDRAPRQARGKVHLFQDYAGLGPRDVPDPYYGGDGGFEAVYRMIREASEALSAKLGARAVSPP
ncbi:MAG: low molecular weight protein-tyrosine-phosphatase [Rhizobiaceae bacterium]